MPFLSRFSELTSWTFSVAGGLGAVAAMVMITMDVMLRMIGSSLPGTYEITVNYFMLIIAFLPLMRVEWLDQMITVEVVYTLVPRAVKFAFLFFAAGLTAIVYCALAYVTWLEAAQKMRVGAYVVTMGQVIPTWPGYYVLPLAFVLGAIAVVSRAILLAAGRIDAAEMERDPAEEGRKLAEAGTGYKGDAS